MENKGIICTKKRVDRIKAMWIIAMAQKQTQKNHLRRECRYYYCKVCNGYHTTSKK